jgi:hypothetical protein
MPIQALVTHLPKADVEKKIATIDGASEVIEVVDCHGGTCLLRSTIHPESEPSEKQRVADMIQSIADADSKLVREQAKKAKTPG